MIKNIALFIDGTWNDDQAAPYTNVQKLFARAELASPAKQVVHYMRGIGAPLRAHDTVPDWLRQADIRLKKKKWYVRLVDKTLMARNPVSSRLHALMGGLFGYGMSRRIMEAYAFLVAHFERPSRDRIYVFGFSRGAYAARSLACFIDKVGLLLKDHLDKVEEAYEIYESGGKAAEDRLNAFLENLTGRASIENGDDINSLPVYMLGVWDTVRELGGPSWLQKIPLFNTMYHEHDVPSNVSHVRHALALHELRERFEPVLFGKCQPWQSLKQVWFAGAHADIGGGYADSTLSDVSLEWMATESAALLLDVAACPALAARKNYSRSVHNVIRGWFIGSTPTVRKFLLDTSNCIFDDGIYHHYVHPSVGQRLNNDANIHYRFFEYRVNVALKEVDSLSPQLWFLTFLCRPAALMDSALV